MKELLPFLRLYKRCLPQMALGVLLTFIALLAAVSLLAISGWFLSASALAGLTLMTAKTFNFFTPGAGVRGSSITRTAARYFERVVNHDATFKLLAHIRVSCYKKLEPLTLVVLQNYRQGDLFNRFVTDTDTLDHLYLRLISPFITAALGCLSIVIFVQFFSGMLALIMILFFLAGIVIIPAVIYRFGHHPGEQISDQIKQLRTSIIDYISGYTDLVINGAEPAFKALITDNEKKLYQYEEHMAFLSGISSAAITILSGLTLLAMIGISSVLVSSGIMPGPVAAMLILITIGMSEAIIPLPQAMQVLGKIKRSAMRINAVLQQKANITFVKEPVKTNTISSDAADIDITHLSYRYPGTTGFILNDLNLHLLPGEKVAITGHTGCGKSTLLNLLTRADNPESGQININQQPVDTFTENVLRQTMAVMPQRIHIFNGTLRDNLLLANSHANDEQLIALLTQLNLHYLCKNGKSDLNTRIGTTGRVLSGGETRRIGIARVLLQDAPIVLLDEPSEGLDSLTEEKVLKAIINFCSNRTLLVLTHKPAILQYMDKIYPWEYLQPE